MRPIALVALLIVALPCLLHTSSADDSAVGYTVTSKDRIDATPLSVTEAEYLRDLERAKTPAEKGAAYVRLADLYYKKGLQDHPEKVVEYSRKALEYPLDALTSLAMYVHWGNGLSVESRGLSDDRYASARTEISGVYLSALRFTLDSHAPRERLPLPAVSMCSCPDDSDPVCRKIKKRHDEELAGRERAEFVNKLVERRLWLENELVSLYSHEPYATEELKRLASDKIKDKKVVADLVSRAQANIEKVGKSEEGSAGTPSK